jgi:RimJ/RimL family protein N-acetyltransferase
MAIWTRNQAGKSGTPVSPLFLSRARKEAPMIMTTTRPGPAISTERLTLRPLGWRDAPRIAELAGDYDVARMTTLPHPLTAAGVEDLYRCSSRANLDDEAWFAIDVRRQGLVGMLSFSPDGDLAPEVSFWIGRPYWGCGLMTEALGAAMRWTKIEWARRCVTARHFVGNPAAARVLERCGFLHTGRAEMRACPARAEMVLSRWMVWLA